MKKHKIQHCPRSTKIILDKIATPLRFISAVVTVAVALLITTSSPTFAQPKNLVGEIEFNEQSSDSPVVLARSEAKAFVEQLLKSAEASAPSAPGALSDRAITYFNATYLYCTVQKGVCPVVLDGLLESEIIGALADKGSSCKVLPKFWRSWLNGGFEERQKYQTKTGFLAEASQFTNSVRPKYIKCDATVKEMLVSIKSASERYGPQGEGREKISKLLDFMKLLEEKKINVFSETGSIVSESSQPSTTNQKVK